MVALAVGLLVLFWPLLHQPFFWDDVDFIESLSYGRGQSFWESLRPTLERCLLPHYFRPLVAPVMWALSRLFGFEPAAYRAVLLLAHFAAAWGIFRSALQVTRHREAAVFSAALYAFSWIHWDLLAMISNMGQAAAHAFFWWALACYLEDPSRLARSAVLASVALLFKEDAIVFPLYALMAGAAAFPARARLTWKQGGCIAAWAAFYIIGRRSLSSGAYLGESFSIGGVLDGNVYWRSLKLLLEPFLHPLPDSYSVRQLLLRFAESPTPVLTWAAVVVAAGTFLSLASWDLIAGKAPADLPKVSPRSSRVAAFSAAGFVLGIMPYAAFRAVHLFNVHRLALAWGAVSLGAGLLLSSAWRAVDVRRRTALFIAWITLANLFFVKAAVDYRYPSPERGPFSRLMTMYETRQVLRLIEPELAAWTREDDRFEIAGLPQPFRLGNLFQSLARWRGRVGVGAAPARWSLRRESQGSETRFMLKRLPSGPSFDFSWPAQPAL